MEFELGQTYSGYKFLDVVTRSRGAVQYRVQNTLAQRVESLRTPAAAAGDDPDAAERFLREVRIRGRLSHPHIVTFYTALPIEGRMAMTTEMPDWLPLSERLKPGPLPWREALDVTRQLLEALACIHQQSLVHCDITPGNILLGPGGFCKLADFSLARPLGPARLPESGAVVGDPRYISPEQVKGERDLDHRSDLYSAGVVLYEMLCGRPPFESRSHFELMMAHVLQAPAPPSGLQPNVPQFLDAVVLKALAKDAGDRYASAAAFGDAIAAACIEPAQEPSVAGDTVVVRCAPAPVAAEPAPAPTPAAAIVTEAVPPIAETVAVAPPAAPTAPMVAEAAAPEGEAIPAPQGAPQAAAVIAEVMAAPEPAIVPEPGSGTEAAPAVAEAAVVPEPVALEPASAETVAVAAPELAIVHALAVLEAPVVPQAVNVPPPEAATEAAAPAASPASVPDAELGTAPANAMVAAVVVPEPAPVAAPVAVPEATAVIVEAAAPANAMLEAVVVPEQIGRAHV